MRVSPWLLLVGTTTSMLAFAVASAKPDFWHWHFAILIFTASLSYASGLCAYRLESGPDAP